MPAFRRVAIMIDLEWPLRHHLDIFAGTQRYAKERGDWECVVDPHAAQHLHAGRKQSRYDGVVARATLQLAERAKRARVPVVNVWLNSPVRNLPSVWFSPLEAGRMAAEHMLARGLRHFGTYTYQRDRVGRLLHEGFSRTVTAAGFSCALHTSSRQPSLTAACWNRSQQELESWLERLPRPTGICAMTDLAARYVAAACVRKKIRVPDEVAIIGTGNELIISLNPEPALTSIDFGFEEIGYQAAKLLDEMMDGAKPPAQPLVMSPRDLIPRQSTDVFAVNDLIVSRAMRFIAEHGDDRITVLDVANHVHTTRRTLERRFQNHVGRTISGEITRLRIERAKRQLVESDVPIKTLASRLGFHDSKRLCETFRRIEGTSPGEYRKSRRIGT